MSLPLELARFYAGKRVLVTGHTGFKGSWLSLWLTKLGAKLLGVALPPADALAGFNAMNLSRTMESRTLDVRGLAPLRAVFNEFKPELVFHLAAQALVASSHDDPVGTFETNVLGTVNVLQCLREAEHTQAAVMITSDKCYENVEQIWGYREQDRLGGQDPYSASKACAEHVIEAFRTTFFKSGRAPRIASTRAGNVVGGGDYSPMRLVPDCVRALRAHRPIDLRNPQATRPWQFVLEPLGGYLLLGMRLAQEGDRHVGAWNFGPDVAPGATVERAAQAIVRHWGRGEVRVVGEKRALVEHNLLQLDCAKARHALGWRPVYDFEQTLATTASWYQHQQQSGDDDMSAFSLKQLEDYERRFSLERA
jgi:CDP-glucose 4,6-dehydratase